MCSCGTKKSSPPPVSSCSSGAASEILIVDEIGLPLGNTSVKLQLSGGGVHNVTTDANGKICLTLPPGTSGQIEIDNIHEAAPGDSTTTGSGRHFAAGGTGP
jgi:hypothetical protein